MKISLKSHVCSLRQITSSETSQEPPVLVRF